MGDNPSKKFKRYKRTCIRCAKEFYAKTRTCRVCPNCWSQKYPMKKTYFKLLKQKKNEGRKKSI